MTMPPPVEDTEELSPRQEDLVSDLLELVNQHGKFSWGTDSEGSHFAPPESNPFKEQGLVCENCVFYAADSRSCAIVNGTIEPEAICKFWVIEDYELDGKPESQPEESEAAAKYAGINFSPPRGVRSAAKRGLALHEKGLSGSGLEPATVGWARKYVAGGAVSPERARMGNRFCGRNARFANAPKDSPAWVSWLLWGGSAGKAWFSSLVSQMDAADKKSSSSMKGGFRLSLAANFNHPFIKEIEVVLTDFEPNANNEGISRSEAENIMRTAMYTPIKIAASDAGYGGHTKANPIGAITEAYLGQHNGRDVIMGKAFIWKDEYPEVYDMLKSQADANQFIGTSWEVYYGAEDTVNGVKWLKNITFAGTCIVDAPAYGDRTPLLSVAEKKEKMNELEKQILELTATLADKEKTLIDLHEKVKFFEEAELQAKAEARAANIASRLSGIFSESEIKEKLNFYVALEDTVLEKIIADLQKYATPKAQSEKQQPAKTDPIPELPGKAFTDYSPKQLAEQFKNLLKEDK